MKDFRGKLAVITGAGSGIGRALAQELVRQGTHVAICDVFEDTLLETQRDCERLAGPDTRVSAMRCDVADEAQVLAFRDFVLQRHATDHIHLLFNNAGIGGGTSFVNDPRASWERTFNVCWFGVYYCARAFLPLLIAGPEGCIVNVSSVNAFFAVAPDGPHSAYSTAKFAVKGFSEGLYTDLRINAPHVKVVLVMPGYIGTSIVPNTMRSFGFTGPEQLDAQGLNVLRHWLGTRGVNSAPLSDEQVRKLAVEHLDAFRRNAPTSPAEAANVILDGIREQRWRVLIGNDARRLDQIARTHPEELYDPAFLVTVRAALEEERVKALAGKKLKTAPVA